MGLVKLNDRGVRSATAFGSVSGGAMVFIKKLTSDGSDDDLSFVNGASDVVLDSTYKEYMFICNDIHPETDSVNFSFNGSYDTSSHSYDIAKTTTDFAAYNAENDSDRDLYYRTGNDLAQGAGVQMIGSSVGLDNDQCCAGYLHLFNPSSTTFVKHFIAKFDTVVASDVSVNSFTAGYFNTTAAITAIQFSMSADEIQGGTISLYGIK